MIGRFPKAYTRPHWPFLVLRWDRIQHPRDSECRRRGDRKWMDGRFTILLIECKEVESCFESSIPLHFCNTVIKYAVI